jgi:hypothetical protein
MQAIHAETEKSDENEDASLTVDRILNYVRELELSLTDRVGNEKAYEMKIEQPEIDKNTAAAAEYCENAVEYRELVENLVDFPASGFSVLIEHVYIVFKFVIKYIKCRWWRCRLVCY